MGYSVWSPSPYPVVCLAWLFPPLRCFPLPHFAPLSPDPPLQCCCSGSSKFPINACKRTFLYLIFFLSWRSSTCGLHGSENKTVTSKWKWNNLLTGTPFCWIYTEAVIFQSGLDEEALPAALGIKPDVVFISPWLKVGRSHLTKISCNYVINKWLCFHSHSGKMCWKFVTINIGYHVARALALLFCDGHDCCWSHAERIYILK